MVKIYPSVKKASGSRVRAVLTWGALCALCLYLILDTAPATGAVWRALNVCVHTVVPALFPYMVLCSLTISSGLAQWLGRLLERPFRALFRMSGGGAAAVVLGLVAGFPVGAKTAAESVQSGLCTPEEGQRLCAFCNNTGPAFVIGGIGAGFFGDARIGVMLYLIEVACALLLGALLALRAPRSGASARLTVRFRPDLPGAVRGAADGVLGVCGYVVFFSVITGALGGLLESARLSSALPVLALILEVTGGAQACAHMGTQAGFILAAGAIGWSGLCVHAQSASYLRAARLSMKKYMAAKALQGCLCALLAAIVCLFS